VAVIADCTSDLSEIRDTSHTSRVASDAVKHYRALARADRNYMVTNTATDIVMHGNFL